MKIRNRLMLSNAAMIVIPMVLMMLMSVMLRQAMEGWADDPDKPWPDADDLATVSRLLAREPGILAVPGGRQRLDESVGWSGFIVVRQDGTVVHAGSPAGYALEEEPVRFRFHPRRGPYLHASIVTMALRPDGTGPAETIVDLYIDRKSVAGSFFLPVLAYMAGAGLILLVTNGSLARLVSRSITKPLSELQARALRIRDGDLTEDSRPLPALGGLHRTCTVMAQDEFDGVFASFDEMRLRLKDSLEHQLEDEAGRRELFAAISHDLRTPLSVIKGYAEGLRDGVAVTQEARRRYIDTILAKSDQLESLIDDLFLVAKLELGGFVRPGGIYDLDAFVRDCLDEIAADYPLLEMRVDTDSGLQVSLDAPQMRRVFDNIVRNAVQYGHSSSGSPEGATVVLEVTTAREATGGGTVPVIRFRDHGPGLPAGEECKVFDRFYRVDASRTGKGSGLGLAIARRIVEGHGGVMEAYNAEGGGAVFRIRLPAGVS